MNKILIPKSDVIIEKPITPKWTSHIWRYYELGVLGTDNDRSPYVDMMPYFDLSGLDAVLAEAKISMQSNQFRNWRAWSSCMIPWELNQCHQFAYYVNHLDELCDPKDRKSIVNIEALVDWTVKQGFEPGWGRTVHLRHFYNSQNRQNYELKNLECQWLEESNLFPVLKSWLETNAFPLFKTVGRIILFKNDTKNKILIHRDFWAHTHNNHFVNFFLSAKPRKFFIYDEVKQEKHYVNTRAFMFNECDLHGSDLEDDEHYTLRIDGVFNDDFVSRSGLANGGWMFTDTHPLAKQISKLTYYVT